MPPPAADRIRAAARPVLGTLGLDRARIRVETYPGMGAVLAAPVVDGLRTFGYETRLFYGAHVELVGGQGWLATPTAGAEYPLVSARKALEREPVPAVAEAPCPAIEPAPPACRRGPLVIVAAEPGLLLTWEVSAEPAGAMLVPAWLYTVRDAPPPLAALAVDSRYLSLPALPDVPTGVPPAPPVTASGAPGKPPAGVGGQPVPTPAPTPMR